LQVAETISQDLKKRVFDVCIEEMNKFVRSYAGMCEFMRFVWDATRKLVIIHLSKKKINYVGAKK